MIVLIGTPHPIWLWLLAVLVGIVSVARTGRLITYDDFPPLIWVRARIAAKIGDSPWHKLFECGFCLAPYLTLGMIAWALLSDLAWWWWLPNIWWGMSYLAAILVSYDQPTDGAD